MFKSEDWRGPQIVRFKFPGGVNAVAVSLEAGEELKPGNAWHVVVRQRPLIVGDVIAYLFEGVLVGTECVAVFGYRFDADDPGVLTIRIGERGDELFGYGGVLGEGVFKFEGIVLVLLDCE